MGPQDPATIVGNRDLGAEEESRLPEVPSAFSDESNIPMFGNAGAAWAGMIEDTTLSDDDDEDFEEEVERISRTRSDSTPSGIDRATITPSAPDLLGRPESQI